MAEANRNLDLGFFIPLPWRLPGDIPTSQSCNYRLSSRFLFNCARTWYFCNISGIFAGWREAGMHKVLFLAANSKTLCSNGFRSAWIRALPRGLGLLDENWQPLRFGIIYAFTNFWFPSGSKQTCTIFLWYLSDLSLFFFLSLAALEKKIKVFQGTSQFQMSFPKCWVSMQSRGLRLEKRNHKIRGKGKLPLWICGLKIPPPLSDRT